LATVWLLCAFALVNKEKRIIVILKKSKNLFTR